jgi:hypothetical protein
MNVGGVDVADKINQGPKMQFRSVDVEDFVIIERPEVAGSGGQSGEAAQ